MYDLMIWLLGQNRSWLLGQNGSWLLGQNGSWLLRGLKLNPETVYVHLSIHKC